MAKKSQHLRNIIIENDMALRVMEWHGGQNSLGYSLASTAAAGKLVSLSMIRACADELDVSFSEDSDQREELDLLLEELREIIEYPDPHVAHDMNDGYATWLMDEDDEEDCEDDEEGSNFMELQEDQLFEAAWYGTVDGEAFDGDSSDLW